MKFLSLLYRLAGYDLAIIDDPRCARDRAYAFAIAASLMIVASSAALSGGYAFFTTTRSVHFALLFGLGWGTAFLIIERSIMLSLEQTALASAKKYLLFGVRIILACVVAVVIAKPIELWIFRTEIESQISISNEKTFAVAQEAADKAFPELTTITRSIDDGYASIRQTDSIARESDAALAAELDGIAPGGKPGAGPVFRAKREQVLGERLRLADTRFRELRTIDRLRERAAVLQAQRDSTLAKIHTGLENPGILSRLTALAALRQDVHVWWASTMITSLLVLIDLTALFAKMMLGGGTYSRILRANFNVALAAVNRDESEGIRRIQLLASQTAEEFDITARLGTELFVSALSKAQKSQRLERSLLELSEQVADYIAGSLRNAFEDVYSKEWVRSTTGEGRSQKGPDREVERAVEEELDGSGVLFTVKTKEASCEP